MANSNVQRTTAALVANPATTTGTLGALIVLIGSTQGWDDSTTALVASVALFLVPLVRGAVAWWKARHPVADEV